MNEVINNIIKSNKDIFEKNIKIEKINIGFTNTIYSVDDKYIVKICSDYKNEVNFKNEIDFYNKNKYNDLIPKLFYYDISKNNIPYYYEIIEKINGVSLYSVWHTFSEEQRENIIHQLCNIMKSIHLNKGKKYNWCNSIKMKYNTLFKTIKTLNIFDSEEENKLKEAYLKFDKYLESNDFVLIHNDLHFDNIFYDMGKIKIIDFERSMYAPRDFELDIIYRMIRKPWKFASEETEKYVKKEDYSNIMKYIEKYYEELIDIPNLYKRINIYDIVYYMEQLIDYPHLKELKDDILRSCNDLIKE